MLNEFQKFLINKGYKEFSSNGSPSTVIDYAWRINKICEKEGITEQQLAEHIDEYSHRYSMSGEMWYISKKSHQSYWNALRNFRKFILLSRFGGQNFYVNRL
jgi:hypothetical protein